MLADADWNAPVGIHTITGASEAGAGLGAQMFSFRQFSLPTVVVLPGGLISGHGGGATVAFNVGVVGAQGAAVCRGLLSTLRISVTVVVMSREDLHMTLSPALSL